MGKSVKRSRSALGGIATVQGGEVFLLGHRAAGNLLPRTEIRILATISDFVACN